MKLFIFLLLTQLHCTNTFAQKKDAARKLHPYLYVVNVNNYVGLQLALEYKLKNKYSVLANLLTTSKRPPDLPENYSSAFSFQGIKNKLNSINISLKKSIPFHNNSKFSFEPAIGISYIKYTSRFAFEKNFSLISNDYFYKSEKAYLVGLNIEPQINYLISKNFSLSLTAIANFNLYKNFYGAGFGVKF
jgi:hypothetical protein